MASIDARITFYKIDRFGYFKSGQTSPEFGDLSETLDDLQKWALQDGMILGNTCTYEVDDEGSLLGTYCVDLVKDPKSGTYLLTTWNETQNSAGQVTSVDSDSLFGKAEVSVSQIPDGKIPGYPTYFWFLPEKEVLATVQFSTLLNGRENLDSYVSGFLRKFTRHVTAVDHGDSMTIKGYRSDNTSYPDLNLTPVFKTILARKPGPIDLIRKERINIRKIMRKETISIFDKENISHWQRAMAFVGITRPSSPDKESERFKLELSHTPSEQELDEILNFWATASHTNDKWEDIGFKFCNQDKPAWLSHSVARSTFKLELKKEKDEVIDASALLEQLLVNSDRILPILS